MKTIEKIEVARMLLGSHADPGSIAKRFGYNVFDKQLVIDAANEHGVWECHNCGKWCGEEELHNDLCSACSCGDKE